MLEPQAIHLAAVACRDERLDMVILDERHEFGELVLREQGLNLDLLRTAKTASYLIERTSAHEVVDDIFADTFVLAADYTYAFALGDRCCEVVDHQTVDSRTDKSDNHHSEIVDHERRAADECPTDSDRRAYIEMQVLVDDLCQYIQSAC